MSEELVTTEAPKRSKKLSKVIEGSVVTLTVEGFTPVSYDFSTFPEDIQAKFGPFGMGHKLGDSAAGKEGQEALDAIAKVFAGLESGDWTVRAPAAVKVSISDIKANLANLSDAEREAAQTLLASLGMKF